MEFLDAALEVARMAGNMIERDFNESVSQLGVSEKSNATDFVTESDKRVESLIMGELRKRFPSHRFIGEEHSSESGNPSWTEEPTWIVDPIDGTTNFIHRIPFVCTSIGLWIEKEPVVGVIYNPLQKELFHAVRGKGAYCNGFPIHVSHKREIPQCIMATTVFPSNEMEKVQDDFDRIRAMLQHGVHGHRTFGSAALNMCYVACGRVDLYFDYGIHCWDMAAGALIITEASGVIKDTSGGGLDIMRRRMLCAASEKLADDVAPKLTQSTFPPDS